jgi:hypothetical protein
MPTFLCEALILRGLWAPAAVDAGDLSGVAGFPVRLGEIDEVPDIAG